MADDKATVFVRNLTYDTTDAELEEHFGEVGPVRRAFVVRDRKTKAGRGFGFVSFVLADDAERAVTQLNSKPFKGRNLSVDSAKKGAEASAAKPPNKGKQPRADSSAPAESSAAATADAPKGAPSAAAPSIIAASMTCP